MWDQCVFKNTPVGLLQGTFVITPNDLEQICDLDVDNKVVRE